MPQYPASPSLCDVGDSAPPPPVLRRPWMPPVLTLESMNHAALHKTTGNPVERSLFSGPSS
jgi:hypothetical protein